MSKSDIVVCFDRNTEKGLALVATPDLRNPKHIPLSDAPGELKPASFTVLTQMHAVANAKVDGLIASQKPGFEPSQWEVLGPSYKMDKAIKERK